MTSTKPVSTGFNPHVPAPPRRNGVILGAMIAIGLVFLGVTNPKQPKYLDYAAWNLKRIVCQQKNLSPKLQFTCTMLEIFPYRITTKPLAAYTRSEDYLLFSVYTTDLLGVEVRTVGIAGQFLSSYKVRDGD